MYKFSPVNAHLSALQAFTQFLHEQIKAQLLKSKIKDSDHPKIIESRDDLESNRQVVNQIHFRPTDRPKIVKILNDLGPSSHVFKMTDRPRIVYANETGLDCFC